jgi:hypothetical protein
MVRRDMEHHLRISFCLLTMLTIVMPITTIIIIIEAAILIAPFAGIPLTALPVVIYLAPFSTVLIGGFIAPLNLSLDIVVVVMNTLPLPCFIHHDNTSANK